MKRFAYIMFSSALLFSCGSKENTAVDKEGNTVISIFSKKIDLPLNPCDYISREMVMAHFDVAESKLELDEDFTDPTSAYAKCGFKWKKSNYDELSKIHQDAMMNYMMHGIEKKEGPKPKLSDLTRLESPYGTILVGNFKQYDDMQKALNGFSQSHHVPTKEEMAALNKEIDKQFAEKGMDDNAKKIGKSLTGGIAGGLKFTKIDGIGDQAFFDHLNRSLDVRFGTFTFKVYFDSELSFEENIEIAKKIAQAVWDKL